MRSSLLSTKLFLPPPDPNLVLRERLVRQLNAGLACRLTLVSAPAGFGKSTLLGAWARQVQEKPAECGRIAWLSLDSEDSDLARFLTYFVAALQTIDDRFGRAAMGAFQTPDAINVEAILTALLNEMSSFAGDTVLVLDDYHVIESPAIDKAVNFLLEHLPPQMHLVIASRMDPSFSLARLRAGGQMTEVRADDLRFTPDETAVFLGRVMGFDLASQDVAALEARTEGWIAGLQLAALAMLGSLSAQGVERDKEINRFVNNFTGSDRYIHDYLADEVLLQRPPGTRDFLLQTSILDRLSGPLCDAVRFGVARASGDGRETAGAAQKDSQAILDGLEAANLFVIPLDNERRWYRYHHLFADLLKLRLMRTFPRQIPDLHRRASLWYENEGFLDAAITHARAADDSERLAAILERHWQDIVHRGEAGKLKRLLDELGPQRTRTSAPLSMAYCWIYVLMDKIDLIPAHLEDIKAALDESPQKKGARQPARMAVLPSLIKTMEATVALEDKQVAEAKHHALKAIALIPGDLPAESRMLLHGAAGYRLALAHRELGELDQACAVLLDGLEMLKASENYFGAAVTVLQIAAIYERAGETRQAVRLCEETLSYMVEHRWDDVPPCGYVHLCLASLLADLGEVEAAKRNLAAGRELVEPIRNEVGTNLVNQAEAKLREARIADQNLVEPLSPRELEVLQLIADGCSNREIGERLFLALDTVKGHNRRIYGKLGVHRRTEAVARARELELL